MTDMSNSPKETIDNVQLWLLELTLPEFMRAAKIDYVFINIPVS